MAHHRRRPWHGRRHCQAALADGHAVVATARNADTVTTALSQHDGLLAVKLDVTYPTAATAVVQAAV